MSDDAPAAPPPEFEPWETLETVLLHRAGPAVRITLNRPDRLNAWIPQLGTDLHAALDLCRGDDVRAVLLVGAGRGFSSGADLRSVPDLTASEQLTGYYHEVLLTVRVLPKPVVAAVHGAAAGIGCSLALSADLVLMAQSAFLLLAFVKVGLVPDGGASLLVPARAGGGRALDMALLGERVPAPQALDWGLASRVFADDELTDAAHVLLWQLAQGPTRTYGLIKQELNAVLYPGFAEQLAREARLQDEAAATADFQEGVAAFQERRPTRFTGR
jgi:2-(1,2-epoxy-1,2-dihydrophenyl)acetyl-CoA isomerase